MIKNEEKYWICTNCGRTFLKDSKESKKHNLKLIQPTTHLSIPIYLCDNCYSKLSDIPTHSEYNRHEAAYPILEIAKYILNYCKNIKQPIDNYFLNRILFMLWIKYYKKTRSYLFEDNFFTDNSGPYFKQVWDKYCGYGAMPIYLNKDSCLIDPDTTFFISNFLKRNFFNESTKNIYDSFALREYIKETYDFNWSKPKNFLNLNLYSLESLESQINKEN